MGSTARETVALLTICSALLGAAWGCDSASTHPSTSSSLKSEREIAAGAMPLNSDTVVVEMEGPGKTHPGDSGTSGTDLIPLHFPTDRVQTFHLDVSDPETLLVQVARKDGASIGELDQDTPSFTAEVAAGDYVVSITNRSPDSRPLFIVPHDTTITDHCEWCVLSGLDLSGAQFDRARFRNARLRKVSFADAQLAGSDFVGADLRGANFSGAHLTNDNFTGAHLEGANFDGAAMERCSFLGAAIDASTHTDSATTSSSAIAEDQTACGGDCFPTQDLSALDLVVSPDSPFVLTGAPSVLSLHSITVEEGGQIEIRTPVNLQVGTLVVTGSSSTSSPVLLVTGERGADGAPGPDGAIGPPGEGGSAGTDGLPGMNGESGSDASDATISIGSLTGALTMTIKGGDGGNGGAGGDGGKGGVGAAGGDYQVGGPGGRGGAGGNGGNGGPGGNGATVVISLGSGLGTVEVSAPESAGGAGGTGGLAGPGGDGGPGGPLPDTGGTAPQGSPGVPGRGGSDGIPGVPGQPGTVSVTQIPPP